MATPTAAPQSQQTKKLFPPRTRRACDQCRLARCRCDGNQPCTRCQVAKCPPTAHGRVGPTDYYRSCTYEQKQKCRGRPPGRISRKKSREISFPEPSGPTQPGASIPPIVTVQKDGSPAPSGASPVEPDPQNAMQSHSAWVTDAFAASSVPSSFRTNQYSQMAEIVGMCPDNITFYHSQLPDHPLVLHDFLMHQDLTARSSLCETNARGSVQSTREDSLTRYSGLSDGSEASSSGSGSLYPYTILRPILPYVNHIISPCEASALLDYFFNDRCLSSFFHTRSPYNFATVFRKGSILRLKQPRPTSPALLAAIFFVAAQTCDEKVFRNRNFSRAKICDELLAIAIQLLGDAAPKITSSRLQNSSESVQTISNLGFPAATDSDTATWRSGSKSCHGWCRDHMNGNVDLDHVVACILCGVVLSGSDLKFDCLMWFEKARMMALILGLNREKDDQLSVKHSATMTEQEVIAREERKEERRRTWWLLYAMDRHLSLCYNVPLRLLDTKCQIYQPLEDEKWQDLEHHLRDAQSPQRPFGPPPTISGPGFFGFFLPCMVVLGDIVELHHLRLNPRYASFESRSFEEAVENALQQLVRSMSCLHASNEALEVTEASLGLLDNHRYFNTTRVVTAYSTFLVNVLAILTYGEWDIVTMLQPDFSKRHGDRLAKLCHYTSLASHAMELILECDPELTFMPYLLGIYILQAGFAVLAVAERTDKPASSAICNGLETFIRAHESCIATLDTKYQRNFRKVLRGTISTLKGVAVGDLAEYQAQRQDILSLHRWNVDGNGLLLT